MVKWYFPNLESFEAKKGFETKFVVEHRERIFPHKWKILEVIPLKKISYEWQFEGHLGRGLTEFILVEIGDKTSLTLTASIIEKYPENIPEFERESSVAGWNYFIKERLKAYLDNKYTN